MKKRVKGLAFLPLLLMVFVWQLRAAESDGRTIIQRSDDTQKVSGWQANARFELLSEDASPRVREALIQVRFNGDRTDAKRRIRFRSPGDIAGTTVLIHEHASDLDDMWIYLPALKKVRRLLSNNRKDSFVGTDFAYNDIVSARADDYTHELQHDEAVDGAVCHVIKSVPKSQDIASDIGYSLVTSWVRKDNLVRVKAEFFDLAGERYKTYRVLGYRKAGDEPGRWLNERVEMTNVQTGHRTLITFQDLRVGEPIPESGFSARSLDR